MRVHWKNAHNCLITLCCTRTWKFDITLRTWWWTFTPMPRICWKQTHAVVHAGIFSRDGFLQTANQSNLTVRSMLHHLFYDMSWLWPLKQSLALYSIIPKQVYFCSILEDLGHHQPKTAVHCNNATAFNIANNSVKCPHSCSIEMQFFWISG